MLYQSVIGLTTQSGYVSRGGHQICHVTQGIFQILAEAELLALDGKIHTFLGTLRLAERFYGNSNAFNL
jgi:hypothetical protein